MIEVGAPDGVGVDPAAATPAQTAGAMLRSAREAAGLHVAALAVAMKVPVAKLDALENDRYDLLPDAVFARALAASICRTLKIDPAPVLARLPQSAKPRLVQDTDGIRTPFRGPRDAVAPHWKEQLTRPVSLIVGALLIGAVVVMLWPRQPGDTPEVASAASADAAAPGPSLPAAQGTGDAAAPAAVASPAPPPEVMTASVAMSPPPAIAAPGAPLAPAASVAVAAPAGATASSAPAAVASGLIVFRASADSWIEVRDAKGAVPVRKLLMAGESAGASGAMPLQVIVGNAGATEVQVRGKPFDLRAITRDNVARFEVK